MESTARSAACERHAVSSCPRAAFGNAAATCRPWCSRHDLDPSDGLQPFDRGVSLADAVSRLVFHGEGEANAEMPEVVNAESADLLRLQGGGGDLGGKTAAQLRHACHHGLPRLWRLLLLRSSAHGACWLIENK